MTSRSLGCQAGQVLYLRPYLPYLANRLDLHSALLILQAALPLAQLHHEHLTHEAHPSQSLRLRLEATDHSAAQRPGA